MYLLVTCFRYYFSDKSVHYSQAPRMKDLMVHVAKNIRTKWREVGEHLGITASILDAFETQSNDPVRLYIKVFDQWKREAMVPYTWDTIISTLEVVDERHIAANIKNFLDNNN